MLINSLALTDSLSPTDRAFLKKLSAIDLVPIAQKLMNSDAGKGWSLQKTMKAIACYLLFLFLIHLYPDRAISPTPEVDTVWHTHILDTQKYREDCQQLFGYFIDHQPLYRSQYASTPSSSCIRPKSSCIRPASACIKPGQSA